MRVPGRLQVVGEDPLTILDGAHNPAGMAALAAALPRRRRRPAGWSPWSRVLDDKDAAGMLRALLGKCRAVVFTASRNPRALPPATLASLAEQLGGPPTELVRDPHAAVRARARARRARTAPCSPRARSTWSPTWSASRPAGGPRRCERRDGPSVLAMIALVAVVVALVILVFFALGYAFGRAFL